MNKDKLDFYKKLLLEEKKVLLNDLGRRGRKLADDGSGKEDWIAVPEKEDGFRADLNENADDIEDYEVNVGVVSELESQYKLVNEALDRIEKGTYGRCNECGKEIEEERLKAAPTAITCIEHSKK